MNRALRAELDPSSFLEFSSPNASSSALVHNLSAITPPLPPTGVIPLSAFEINVTSKATLAFCFNYSANLSQISESTLSVYEFNTTSGTWINRTFQIDTASRQVCGYVVSAHTPYLAAASPAPVPTPVPTPSPQSSGGSSGSSGGGGSSSGSGGSSVSSVSSSSSGGSVGGSSGSSGGGGSKNVFVFYHLPKEVRLKPGNTTQSFTLASYYTGFLRYANFSLSGFPQDWHTVPKNQLFSPLNNQTVTILWTIPKDARGTYPVRLELVGVGTRTAGLLRASYDFTIVLPEPIKPVPSPKIPSTVSASGSNFPAASALSAPQAPPTSPQTGLVVGRLDGTETGLVIVALAFFGAIVVMASIRGRRKR